LKRTIEEREQTIAAQTKKIHKLEDKIFKDFSRKVGVTNIRDYEEKRQAFEKEKNEKRLAFSNQESLLRNQYGYFILLFCFFFMNVNYNFFKGLSLKSERTWKRH
jgi:structural maintenance of chromosome 1